MDRRDYRDYRYAKHNLLSPQTRHGDQAATKHTLSSQYSILRGDNAGEVAWDDHRVKKETRDCNTVCSPIKDP